MQFISEESETSKFKRYCEYESMSPVSRQSCDQKDLPLNDIQHRGQKSTASIIGIEETLEKKKSGLKKAYSRENLQIMNKKMKQIKENMFGGLMYRTPDKKETIVQMKLTGFSKSLAHISQKKNIQCVQMLKTSYNPEQKNKDPIKVKKNLSDNLESKTYQEHGGFRTTLKKKYVDDNPKVLANIIRRKVQILKSDQIQLFIQNLTKRNRC